ncbi:MAG: class I SAM-dependent methyltransferase [Parvibaculaceae bacterium]
MTPDPFKLFLEVQLGLPRNGPGSRAATQEVFSCLRGLPAKPAILDIGCGQAPEAFDLLDVTDGHITAVDLFEPFLDKASVRASAMGIGEDRLAFERGDMAELEYDDESFDLIWSEGAIYLLGFEEGLRNWAQFAKRGGFVVVSELTWLKSKRTPMAESYWGNAYPEMGTLTSNRAAAEAAGYEVIGTMILPLDDWRDNYYTPLREKIAAARKMHGPQSTFDDMEDEITVFEKSAGDYSYVFYILKRL